MKIDIKIYSGWEKIGMDQYFQVEHFPGSASGFKFIGNYSGDCYVRIQIIGINSETAWFYFSASMSGVQIINVNETVTKVTKMQNKKTILIASPNKQKNLRIKYSLSSHIQANLIAVSPQLGITQLFPLQSDISSCLPQATAWYIIINDTNNTDTKSAGLSGLTSTNITLYYDDSFSNCLDSCPKGQIWNDALCGCQKNIQAATQISYTMLVGFIIGGCALIFVGFLLVYSRCWKKYPKNQ